MITSWFRNTLFAFMIVNFLGCKQTFASEVAVQPQRPIIAFDLHGVVLHYQWTKILPTLICFNHKWDLIKNLYKLPVRRLASIIWAKPSFEQIVQAVSQTNVSLRNLLIDLSVQQKMNDDVAAVIQRLAAGGYTLHVLSNIGAESFSRLQEKFRDLFRCFSFVLTSNFVDQNGVFIRKPDPAFFTHYLEKSSARASNVVFIDDRKENVEEARRLGMRAIHFKNAKQLSAELTGMGITA